jgi:hypothetical protein
VRAVLAWLEYQDRVGLPITAQAGQVGEGTVRAEDVVAVVAAHLEPARWDDQPFAWEGG